MVMMFPKKLLTFSVIVFANASEVSLSSPSVPVTTLRPLALFFFMTQISLWRWKKMPTIVSRAEANLLYYYLMARFNADMTAPLSVAEQMIVFLSSMFSARFNTHILVNYPPLSTLSPELLPASLFISMTLVLPFLRWSAMKYHTQVWKQLGRHRRKIIPKWLSVQCILNHQTSPPPTHFALYLWTYIASLLSFHLYSTVYYTSLQHVQ